MSFTEQKKIKNKSKHQQATPFSELQGKACSWPLLAPKAASVPWLLVHLSNLCLYDHIADFPSVSNPPPRSMPWLPLVYVDGPAYCSQLKDLDFVSFSKPGDRH
jgi:hypothetical protein